MALHITKYDVRIFDDRITVALYNETDGYALLRFLEDDKLSDYEDKWTGNFACEMRLPISKYAAVMDLIHHNKSIAINEIDGRFFIANAQEQTGGQEGI